MRVPPVISERRSDMRLPRIELPAVAAILAATLGFVAYPLSDYDFFWHLRTGYLILESGSIPKQDPYSFTAPGAPWEVQGWLFDLAMALVHQGMGDAGLRLFFALWVVAVFSVVHATVRLYLSDTSRALPVTLASAAGASMYFVARPLLATSSSGLHSRCSCCSSIDAREGRSGFWEFRSRWPSG